MNRWRQLRLIIYPLFVLLPHKLRQLPFFPPSLPPPDYSAPPVWAFIKKCTTDFPPNAEDIDLTTSPMPLLILSANNCAYGHATDVVPVVTSEKYPPPKLTNSLPPLPPIMKPKILAYLMTPTVTFCTPQFPTSHVYVCPPPQPPLSSHRTTCHRSVSEDGQGVVWAGGVCFCGLGVIYLSLTGPRGKCSFSFPFLFSS